MKVSATEDSGFTWPIDHPDRKFHNMWLTTSRERATGSTLRHEIRHVVLNTRFPDRLPPWIEEGLASRSDDSARQRTCRETAASFSQSGWPDIHSLMELKSIHSTDRATYGASTSLVNYLLTLGDMPKLLQFAVAGEKERVGPAPSTSATAFAAFASSSPNGTRGLARSTNRHVPPSLFKTNHGSKTQ